MRLWTIQHYEAFNILEKTGTLRTNEKYMDLGTDFGRDFGKQYLWMAKQMKARIGFPPKDVVFPVWAWHTWEGEHKRPDMRSFIWNWSEDGIPIVLLSLDVPDDQVLLSDYDFWNFVLDDCPLQLHKRIGQDCSEEEKVKSWETIFEVEGNNVDTYHYTLSIQASLWEIKKEWVKKVEFFRTR